MADDKKTEVRNKETFLGVNENKDGSPIKEVVEDGKPVAEIRNKETFLGINENKDGSPIKEVVSKK